MKQLVSDIHNRHKDITKYRNYFDGKQKVTFVGHQLQTEYGRRLESLSFNLMPFVVTAVLDRLKVKGFEDGDEERDYEAQAERYWRQHSLEKLANDIHLEALTTGDAYVIVETDAEGVPHVYVQDSLHMAVEYDPSNPSVLQSALKVWQLSDGTWRANHYTRDAVWKYASTAKGQTPPDSMSQWQQFSDWSDESWPVIHNYGRVPVFHFATAARIGQYGKSDLHDLLPLQDRINQTLAGEAIAEEFQAYRQRWATGIQPVTDDDGNTVSPFQGNGADRVWVYTDSEAKFGTFDATDLTQFETILEGHAKRILNTASLPLHMIDGTGSMLTGEAIDQAQSPLIAKVRGRQSQYGSVWNQVMSFVVGLMNPGKPTPFLSVVWASPHNRGETVELQNALVKQQLGVSRGQVLRELGYTQPQIDAIAQEREDEHAREAELRQRLFNSGVIV